MIPVLLLLSAGSGAAALIYELVWFQFLELAVGSTAVSLGVLLAAFMGGMCLGSIMLPRLVSPKRPALLVYASIELGIGVFGSLSPRLLPLAGSVYTAWAGYALSGFLLRGAVAAVCLLPPTLLMGATLPALARAVQERTTGTHRRSFWLGLLYASNIGGAVLGCLLSGFYLLRVYDAAAAAYAAAAVNLAVAGIALALAKRSIPGTIWGEKDRRVTKSDGRRRGSIYVAIGLSGLCALAAEAIWTRTLGLLLGASVYTLSIILAVFLAGLGVGSGIGSSLGRRLTRPGLALGWCQLLLAGAIAWSAHSISGSLPYWPIDPSLSSNLWFTFELDLARALWALLPPAILWGASFPLALAAAASKGRDSARLMAGVYASNTLGAIIGALGASLFLIPWAGSQRTQQTLIVLSIAAGLLLLVPAIRPRWIGAPAAAAALLLGAASMREVPPASPLLIAYGRYAATWADKSDIVYTGEGVNSSVAVSRFSSGALTFHVAGKIQASNVPRDMRLQRMLGHLTTLTVADPRSVLVIGCGAGITAGAVSIDPRVERETIIEIEPLVPKAASAYFGQANFDVLNNPKVGLRIDDGRHYLLTAREKFDGITVDPLDPWVKGAATLYTREFFEDMKRHLSRGGAVTMYIQLFETNLDAVKSAVATFFEVFPNGTIWGNPYQGKGHDMVLLGQAEPLRIDLDAMERRFGYRDDANKIPQSLAEIGMESPEDLFATYAGRRSDLTDWLKGAAINRDRNLRMEYLAGLGLNLDESASIYAGMLAYRRFPEDLFAGAEGRVDSLRRAMR
ncbi:MAG TPA: fused MFS/spermidine synthase [Bryobacteraceae bacterium]